MKRAIAAVAGALIILVSAPAAANATVIHSSPTAARAYARTKVSYSQYKCLNNIFTRESGWRWNARNPYSGAYGIPQALPGRKMRSAGSDWHDNAHTQIRWGISYIRGRYGSPCKAWSFWQRHHWY